MPAVYTDPLILDIMARTDKLERAMKSARAQFATEADQMRRASVVMRRQLETDSAAAGAAFKRMAGAIGGYFSGREILALTNSLTQFQNSLRVAGVASADLGAVQDRLFTTAQKYGVELGTLGQLFGSLTNASKELGASQEQIFKLTDVVSASLKVSGQSATEAGGALLQLGQALRGGKVQAEEYNSLLDGMFPLLEAAAAGSERWGGSVAKLTADVKAGTVASQELFGAILNGSGEVIKRAELSTLSLASAFTQVKNALTVYVGEAAQSSGAQAALAVGIGKIAENLDTLIPALAIVGTAMAVKYVASAGAATLASMRAEAALLGLTTRAEIAGYAFGTLARSLAINGALLAVTAAIGSFASEAARTSALVQQANTQYDEMRKRLEAAAGGASAAGDGARGVGDGAAAAEPQVRSFAGAVGALADQLYRQAQAARAAKVEMLGRRLAESQAAEIDLGRRTPGGRNASVADFRRGDFLNNFGVISRAAGDSIKSLLSGGRTDREIQAAFGKQVEISRDLQRQIKEAQSTPLEQYAPAISAPPPVSVGGRGAGRGATGGERSPSVTQGADQRREEQERIQGEIANAQIGYLQELAATTQNAADRATLEKQVIEETRKANAQEINNREEIHDSERRKLLTLNDQVAALRAQQVSDREVERLRQQHLAIAVESLRAEDDILQRQADLANTQDERRRIELRRVDLAYQIERAQAREDLAQAEIAGDTERIAAARKRMADLEEAKGLDVARARQATETPFERYRRELSDPRTDVEEAVVRRLEEVDDGITDAISKALGVKDPLIKDLLNILIQQVLMKPIADALAQASGMGGLGRGGGGIGSIVGSLLGLVFGCASGGYVTPNGLTCANHPGDTSSMAAMKSFQPWSART